MAPADQPAAAPPARAASIWDVARAAGVSHQTVSRVINGSTRVREETRRLVQDAIAELGFRPNRTAQALAGGPVRAVTVLTADTALYGVATTLRGIEYEARHAGYAVGISVLEPEAVRSTEDVAGRVTQAGNAVAVVAFDAAGARALSLLPAHYPVAAAVELPERPDGPATDQSPDTTSSRPRVWTDDRAAAADATRYLLDLGHRTVHHIAIPSSTSPVGQRARGWQDALVRAGRPVPQLVEGGWSPRSGCEAARALVADPRVTAILCGNDNLALGVLRAAREAGRDVPGSLSVVGFDDAPQSAYLAPALTTVRLDFEGLGRACFGLLRRLLEPENTVPTHVWDEPRLVVRESSGPPPAT
jgi:DNA-binding LacI/PurR family transcriptional regulator